ncbi:MAG: hypothetical protein KH135_04270 [Firmicutes bacterium]|nr:hypothetical protein [Bacillota bacterium]
MLEKFKNNMFYIGILIMSLTLFFEHAFHIETDITCFIKGFACGLEMVGVFILIKNQK